mgnify:CR=1 FL=1
MDFDNKPIPPVVLIPAYEPDAKLLRLVEDLHGARLGHVVVVDDGSGPAYAHLFAAVAAAGATVLTHEVNRGKGAALKTGFAYTLAAHPGAAVVCADSDGQHSVVDIGRVADHLRTSGAELVLGGRRFTGDVPVRSRFGNAATRHAFALATGRRVHDTQTGLRGHAAATLPWLLDIRGDRFEYELRVLLAAAHSGMRMEEIKIETIYLEHNASSHFRPIRDSLAVWGQLLAFTGSSLIGFAVDLALLAVIYPLTGSLLAAVIGARLVSATLNFSLNRRFVFTRGREVPLARAAFRYAVLAGSVLTANVLLMESLNLILGSLVAAKVLTELTLFTASFLLQRTAVFLPTRDASTDERPTGTPSCLRDLDTQGIVDHGLRVETPQTVAQATPLAAP